MKTFKDRLILTSNRDIDCLVKSQETYGDSWCKRGGPGAFFNFARKWDRIENLCSKHDNKWDIFAAALDSENHPDFAFRGDLLEDIADLRRYLLLVEVYVEQIREKRRVIYEQHGTTGCQGSEQD